MKALLLEWSLPRFAAARVASEWRSGAGGKVGPLRLTEIDEPSLPGFGWHRVRPRLAGICGSDLATVDGRASRYFEPIVSFPFVPGHEVVGETDGGERVVIEPLLRCATRGIDPPCVSCATGSTNRCHNVAYGHLQPGLQTGYCAETGGGWGLTLIAHESQIHPVPDDMPDEAAVMVEPTACAIHGALVDAGDRHVEPTAVVIGAGTLGLCTIAAVSQLRPDIDTIIAVAKHPEQRRWARELGATIVVEPGELRRAVRRQTGSGMLKEAWPSGPSRRSDPSGPRGSGMRLTGGAGVVFDCVGTSESIADAVAIVQPGGTVVLLGMPGPVHLDLTGLWQREVRLAGAYAYGTEPGGRRTFDLAFELVREQGLERLVSKTYPLDHYKDAIDHAANAGRRGAIKVAFDLRREKRR